MTGNRIEPGQPIRADDWHALERARLSSRLLSGRGVRFEETSDGVFLRFHSEPPQWQHSFRVLLSDRTMSAIIRPGLVNGIEPKIGGVPLSGDQQVATPKLVWKSYRLDLQGRGWIAVEVTLNEKWEVTAGTIVQVADLDSDDGEVRKATTPAGYSSGGTLTLSGRRARHPLAMLRQRANGKVVAFQITLHDLVHRAKLLSGKSSQARHFFFPTG